MTATHRNAAFFGSVALLVSLGVAIDQAARPESRDIADSGSPIPNNIVTSMPAMPLAFEPNQGQADPAVYFLTQRGGRSTFLTDEGATFVVGTDEPSAATMRLVGANREIDIEPLEPLPTRKHYYMGNDPDKWVTNVPTFGRIRYHQVYPGIDLDFYSNGGRLEYDFIVAPAADPSLIRLAFEGDGETTLRNDGSLVFRTAAGVVRHHKPLIYQETAGERTQVQGAFRREADGAFRFELADYDRLLALVIDPEITFATYAGGDLFDFAVDGAYEPNGDLWVIGNTFSPNFPGPQNGATVPAGGNAFVNQYVLESSEPGNDTYSLANVMIIGGSGDDSAGGIALGTDNIFNEGIALGSDNSFNGGKGQETEPGIIVFVGGNTDSADFPMLGPLAGGTDMWVAQIGPVGLPAFSSGGKGGPPPITPRGIIHAASFGTPFNDPFFGFGHPPHPFTPGFPPCPPGFTGFPPGSGFCPPGFPGFPPGHPGFPGSPVFDYTGDGTPNIIFFGDMGSNGPNPFNNITMLDAATLNWTQQWEVGRTGGDAAITTVIFDSQTWNFAGHANQDLADAEKPGGAGVYKTFVGAIRLDDPLETFEYDFVPDDTPGNTEKFLQAAVIRPFVVDEEDPRYDIFVAGTEVPNVGNVRAYVDKIEIGLDPFSIQNHINVFERTAANYTALEIDNTLNLNAFGHKFFPNNNNQRQLIVDKINRTTFDLYDSLTLGDATTNSFAQGSALMTNGSGWTGFAGAAGGFPTSPGAPQSFFGGPPFDGYIFKTENLDLNPLAIVTAGGFKGAPFVPYGIYTAFFDWPRIPGLILPPLVDGKFPKEAGGMVVKMNGEPTAITAVSNKQVNFIAHNNVDQNETATLQLCYTDPITGETFESNIATMPAQSSWVNLFEIDGAVAAIHSNGLMTRENRQHRGDFLAVYGTGGGGFGNPSIKADELAPLDEIVRLDNIPEFKAVVGGQEFEVEAAYGGLAPGLTVGANQFNLIFPEDFWVFACQQTNVEYTLTVTDTETGSVRTYENELGQAAAAITDTQAFATCP